MLNDIDALSVLSRRDLLKAGGVAAAAITCPNLLANEVPSAKRFFTIGLSQYSLHRTIRSGKLKPVDYPEFAKKTFGIDQIDVWDGPFPPGESERKALAKAMRKRADDIGSKIFLFMVGILDAASSGATTRQASIDEISYWLDHAAVLGCRYYRIFLRAADGDETEALARAADSLQILGARAKERNIKIAIEPGGSRRSQRGDWLAKLIAERKPEGVVLMPDFGKLQKNRLYEDTEAMMPFSEVVSAKSIEFNDQGLEVNFDYPRLFDIIAKSKFRNIVAIEYEGSKHSELDGIRATQQLLERIHAHLLKGK